MTSETAKGRNGVPSALFIGLVPMTDGAALYKCLSPVTGQTAKGSDKVPSALFKCLFATGLRNAMHGIDFSVVGGEGQSRCFPPRTVPSVWFIFVPQFPQAVYTQPGLLITV